MNAKLIRSAVVAAVVLSAGVPIAGTALAAGGTGVAGAASHDNFGFRNDQLPRSRVTIAMQDVRKAIDELGSSGSRSPRQVAAANRSLDRALESLNRGIHEYDIGKLTYQSEFLTARTRLEQAQAAMADLRTDADGRHDRTALKKLTDAEGALRTLEMHLA